MNITKAGPRSSGADVNRSSPPTALKRTAVSDTCGWWLTGLYQQTATGVGECVGRKAVPMAAVTLDSISAATVVSHTFDPDAALAWVCVGKQS
jgi:hypothetical protein